MEYLITPVFFLSVFNLSKKFNYIIFKKNNDTVVNILSFSIILLIIYIINAYSVILNINPKFFNYGLILIIIINFIYILFKKKLKIEIKKTHLNFYLTLYLILYFILIKYPFIDADSLRYHLPIAKKILNGTFFENHWFDYLAISAHEFLNVFFLTLNISNGSSILNFIYIIFAILGSKFFFTNSNLGNKDSANLIIFFSAPYLTSLITSEKLFLMPSILISIVGLYLIENYKKINVKKLHLMGLTVTFCILCKLTFSIYFLFFFISILFLNLKFIEKIKFYLIQFILFLIVFFPIFWIKYNIYEDPFLPVISLNTKNFLWFSEYKYWLTTWNMDFTDNINNRFLNFFLIPIKLLVPLSPNDFFRTLGIGVIFLFFIFKNKKKYIYLVFLFLISVILLQNFQSRWFLPILILISFIISINKNEIIFKFLKIQTFLTLCILFILSLITFTEKIKITNYSINDYPIYKIKNINRKYKDSLIFTNSNYFYYFENYVPIYYPEIMSKFKNNFYYNSLQKNNMLLWNKDINLSVNNQSSQHSINSAEDFIKKLLKCNNYQLIQNYKFNYSRNFFKKKMHNLSLYKINCQSAPVIKKN